MYAQLTHSAFILFNETKQGMHEDKPAFYIEASYVLYLKLLALFYSDVFAMLAW